MSQSPREMIPYTKHQITPEDEAAVLAVLRSPFLTQGPVVEQFEAALAEKAGAKYCVCVNSGTTALYLSYGAVARQDRNIFVTTPISFVATANHATYFGRIAFIDVSPTDGQWTPSYSQLSIDQPVVLVPVTLGGIMVNWQVPAPLGSSVVVDATHSLGAASIGNADAMCFSFHPAKHVACGEGGAIVTNSKEVDTLTRSMRDHGRNGNRECVAPGWNFRMSDIHAALGLSQLARLDQNIARRRQIAAYYDGAFTGSLELVPHGTGSARHLYQILTDQRDAVRDALTEEGVGSQIHYRAIHLHPYYQERWGFKVGDFPNAEQFAARTLSIPMYPSLTDAEVEYVASTVKRVVEESHVKA
mgnify:FL=1